MRKEESEKVNNEPKLSSSSVNESDSEISCVFPHRKDEKNQWIVLIEK